MRELSGLDANGFPPRCSHSLIPLCIQTGLGFLIMLASVDFDHQATYSLALYRKLARKIHTLFFEAIAPNN
jgi:hypothetical protein